MAKTIIAQSKNFTKKHMINMLCATTLQAVVGTDIDVRAMAIVRVEQTNDKGELDVKNVGIMVTPSEECITTISPTAIECIEAGIDYLDEQETDMVTFGVIGRKSKSNRDFISLALR